MTCTYCDAHIPLLVDKCPSCDRFITPEASKELQDILDNLEGALVDLKSGKDLERNKATVERYARKAKLYYNNNPKIKILLDEIGNEVKNTDIKIQRHKRDKTINVLLRFAPLILGIIWLGIGINNKDGALVGLLLIFVGMFSSASLLIKD